jgi:hypothetical protein
MTSTSGSSQGSTFQASTSQIIGRLYSNFNRVQPTTNPAKVILKYGLFQFEEDDNTTPWHVPSPLNLNPATTPLPNCKDHFSKFSGNKIIFVNEH